ncbi:CHC group protein [Heterostelium album PN500]|uniref:CHC group protein n=1 Tax=Heterostelium pallidum (strain ATCC 26659 / Pp 5 / PN500) TaxID=670386 RepID=D3AX80_HETP5|nr:CHC group protein [Heterostelium album PN500]EFA86149.1 CHC group protein [Heterostelium album PN500]|eukprot:XP_020438254.1 CHC group protein [Heterostelium album PN500]
MSKKHNGDKKDKKKQKTSSSSSSSSSSLSAQQQQQQQQQQKGGGSGGSIINPNGCQQLPTSQTLPVEQLVRYAPECLLFTQLLEFEKKIDSAITKRLVDMQEAQKSRSSKQFRTLRLSIYNTYACQSAYYHLDNKAMMSVTEKPSWTLRIEGRLLDDPFSLGGGSGGGSGIGGVGGIGGVSSVVAGSSGSSSVSKQSGSSTKQQKRKFSSFFKKIFVQIGHRDSCEWDKSQSFAETDGFEIKRNGNQELDIKILMHLDHTPQKSKVLGPLSQLLNIHTDTKPKIIASLWHYIKINKLLDIESKKIICDEALKNRKHGFMEKLSEDPLGFLSELVHQQIKDYQISKSMPSTGFEEERHSSFYYQPMMEDTVQRFLSKQATPTPTPQTVVPSTPQTDSSS